MAKKWNEVPIDYPSIAGLESMRMGKLFIPSSREWDIELL